MNTEETQLLKDYSDIEKGAYLAAIATVASADRQVTEQEVEFLNLLSEAAGLAPNTREEVITVAKNPSAIDLQKSLDVLKQSDLRFSFVTDVMSFAKADGQLDAEEEKKIQQMAQYLGINDQQFHTLEQFVDKAEEAGQKGEDPTDPAFLNKTGLANSFGQSGIPLGGMMKGLLGIIAPMVISRMMSGRRGSTGAMGGMGGGMGGMLGGLLGGMMGGGAGTRGGLGGLGGGASRGGGLGSLMGVLGGLGGQKGYNRGGLGSLLGSVLGGGKGSRW
ncbi:MAG: TerB family tellurite resistance protein [Adhaeribacter sp.]